MKYLFILYILLSSLNQATGFVVGPSIASNQRVSYNHRRQSSSLLHAVGPTELPDSLEDAAIRAAEASATFGETSGPLARCRVDFDTSVGDETYTKLKASTDFMQKFVTALCYAMIPGAQQQKQEEMMKVASARAELQTMENAEEVDENRKEELMACIANNGRDTNYEWKGPLARVYFPDEGSAALARRDWLGPDQPKVPPCVVFSSCGGVQVQDIKNDELIFFFCPKASESEYVEKILYETEQDANNLRMSVFVNPSLVDMGVTGFGMAGRLLRERLIDPLMFTYYLRTLPWGALTRKWPQDFSVWQEDENAEGGYRLIKTMDRLPSNPEVEDIYDIENGLQEARQSGGVLDQLGDFMSGMMKL